MGRVKRLHDRRRLGLVDGDAQLVGLAAVADIGGPGQLSERSTRGLESGDRVLLQCGCRRAHGLDGVFIEGEQEALAALHYLRRGGDADGREHSRVPGHEHLPDTELGCELAGMERAGPPEGHEREAGGVVAAFETDPAEGAGHGRVRHLHH